MRVLKQLLAIAALTGALGGCYVESHPHYYYHHAVAYRTCRPGYYWDGYYCRAYHY